MTVYKPILTRPIEIQDDADYYSIDYNIGGGGWTAADINPGVYANIAALLNAIQTAANAVLAKVMLWTLVEDTTNKIVKARCSNSTDATTFLIRLGATLCQILGEPNCANTWEISAADPQNASYAPEFTWIPRWQNATRDRFRHDPRNFVKGTIAKDGNIVGNDTGPDLQYRKWKFTNELAKNIFDEAAETALVGTYNVDVNRNLYTFVKGSVSSSPSDAGNPSTRGFFIYPDWNDIIDSPSIVPGGTAGTSGSYEGLQYDLASTADRFTFCQFSTNPIPPPGAMGEHGKLYYDTNEFEIHTIESMPTWQAPDQT